MGFQRRECLQEALFLEVSKSQASRFYEEADEDGEPVLRPAAGGEHSAQLVGLADHVIMRVCITSKLPLPVKVRCRIAHCCMHE